MTDSYGDISDAIFERMVADVDMGDEIAALSSAFSDEAMSAIVVNGDAEEYQGGGSLVLYNDRTGGEFQDISGDVLDIQVAMVSEGNDTYPVIHVSINGEDVLIPVSAFDELIGKLDDEIDEIEDEK